MVAREPRMADKTTSAPFFADVLTLRRITRFQPQDFLDVVAITAGSGRHVSYGPGRARSRHLEPGDIVLFRPVDDVMLEGLEPAGMTVQNVSFPVEDWAIFADLAGVDPAWSTAADPPMARFDPESDPGRGPFAEAIERFRTEPTRYDLVRFWVALLPLLFPRSRGRHPGRGAPTWLLDAVAAMRAESELRVGLPRLLQLAHVTAAHLSATTRRYYGMTPTELVLDLRLRHAAVLLTTTRDPIGGIADRCGFGTFAYFSTAFRRRHGVTPRAYRERSVGRLGMPPR